ncbi:glucokinase, partial [candidate division GN15 bacterium]|nr:glucokinase [candidate division GN15 bacterium]
EQALAGTDETATRALDLFIDCYAAETSNLALKGMTLGGIYVGGQIAPRILTAMDQGRFMQRFVKKGKMENLLAAMPVRVIIEDRAALIGAAAVARGF